MGTEEIDIESYKDIPDAIKIILKTFQTRIHDLESGQEETKGLLQRATFWLMGATILGAGAVIWDILKFKLGVN